MLSCPWPPLRWTWTGSTRPFEKPSGNNHNIYLKIKFNFFLG
jgi:hypothetical protein